MNYLRAQVNFRQLRAETAGNRYLRRFLPASAGIFTCGSVYLRPSQVILHAPVLQCTINKKSWMMKDLINVPQDSKMTAPVFLKIFSEAWKPGKTSAEEDFCQCFNDNVSVSLTICKTLAKNRIKSTQLISKYLYIL